MNPTTHPSPLTFYVSPDGNDDSNGRRATRRTGADRAGTPIVGPFATPERARDAVREARGEGYSGAVRVLLRGGVYRLEETLRFDARDSAAHDGATDRERVPDRVVWEAYRNETPVFDGGVAVTGWKPAKKLPAGCPKEARGRLFVASVPKQVAFSRLFFDGHSLPRAASVDGDDWRSRPLCELGDDPETEIVVPAGTIPAGDDCREAILDYMPTPYTRWSNAFSPVVSIDRRRRIIRHEPFVLPRPDRTKAIPFRLENVASGLTASGRWFLDSAAGLLYLIPREGADPNDHLIVAPRLTELVRIEAQAQLPVRRFTLRGITFRHARLPEGTSSFDAPGGALLIDGLADCRIERCRFERLGGNALRGGPRLSRITIRQCEVDDAGGGGVILSGTGGLPPFPCIENRIEECVIHGCGRRYLHSSGISVQTTEATRIRANTVYDLPYAGIFVGGGPRHTYFRGWPRSFPELEALWREHGDGEPTIDGVKRFIPGHCRIERNTVHHVMQQLDDGAAIYCHASHHSMVRGNVVYAVRSPMGMGLYFDDEEMDSVMDGNLVYRCPDEERLDSHSAVVHLHHNGRHRLVNNILIGGKQVLSVPNGYGGHRIERNIFVFSDEPNWNRADPKPAEGPGDGRRQVGWNAGPSVVRRNLWWSPRGKRFAASLLAEWKKLGYGEGSIAADPCFVDAKGDDYRLREASPATELGIRPLVPGRAALRR
jgi:hypothetical protein